MRQTGDVAPETEIELVSCDSNREPGLDAWRVHRIASELVDGFEQLREVRDGVAIFGSARLRPAPCRPGSPGSIWGRRSEPPSRRPPAQRCSGPGRRPSRKGEPRSRARSPTRSPRARRALRRSMRTTTNPKRTARRRGARPRDTTFETARQYLIEDLERPL